MRTLEMLAHVQWLMMCLTSDCLGDVHALYQRLEGIEAYLIRRVNREE